jgi:hypothetical protein
MGIKLIRDRLEPAPSLTSKPRGLKTRRLSVKQWHSNPTPLTANVRAAEKCIKDISKRKGFKRFIQQKIDTQKNSTDRPSCGLCLVRVLLTRSYPSVFSLVSFPATRPKASLWWPNSTELPLERSQLWSYIMLFWLYVRRCPERTQNNGESKQWSIW